MVNIALECARSIRHTKWRDQPFIETESCTERYKLLISFGNSDLMEGSYNIKLGNYFTLPILLSVSWIKGRGYRSFLISLFSAR